jgi:hypothetical protein
MLCSVPARRSPISRARLAVPAAAFAVIAFMPIPARAADRTVVQRGAQESPRVQPEVIDVDLRDLPVAREWEPGDPIKEIPRRSNRPPRVPEREQEGGPDPLLERQAEAELGPRAVDPTFPTPILNFPGQGFTGVTPPDTVGDVGPNHYIQIVNHGSGSAMRIHDKTGAVVAGPIILDTLGTGGACASGLGDPVVLYDSLADRWLVSEFAAGANALCVYVSQTNNPVSGGWFRYQFNTPNFPDYPKYAVWPDAYYVSTNESSPAAYALDRNRMLQGLSATSQRFTAPDLAGFPFQALTPADIDGASPPPAGAAGIFMRHRDDEVHNAPGTGSDFLEIWEFKVNWTTPGSSTFTGPINIAVSDFSSELCGLSSFSCFEQPGSTPNLDPLREVIMFRLQYRNFGTHQMLAGNLVTDADGEGGGDPLERGGVRWFELRKTGAAWTLFQEGTYSPDANPRWMGASAMDGSGNFAVGYNISSNTVFPGLRYAGRLSNDPTGTLPQGEATIVNGSAANSSNRYGDYAALSVDPSDDCTFWFTGEFNTASQWSTRIATFKFAACGGPPTPNFSLSCSPSSVTAQQGSSGGSTCTVASTNGFNSAVSLSCTGLPAGASCAYVPNPVTPPANGSVNSALTVSTTGATPVGSFPFVAQGVSGATTRTFNMTLVVTPTGGSELLVNGGFETSCAPWTSAGTGFTCVQGGPFPHAGAGYTQFIGNNNKARLFQQVAIPPSAPANLTFWTRITTNETTTTAQNDLFFVEVRDTSNTLLATIATLGNLDATSGYVQRSFSLAAFRGQTIRLYFRHANNGSLNTRFLLDDVSLQ